MYLYREINNNLVQTSVPLEEIVSVKEKDSIPNIDNPTFISIIEAKEWLKDTEPVITLDNKAYPIQIMMWHEVVNNGNLVITYCPLCSSSFIFDNAGLNFGVSGLLRNSNLIMYDRETDSLWQQFTGNAIVGEKVPERLNLKPASVVSFKDFYESHPDGLVLSENTGYNRNYGTTPYVNYDNITNEPPFFTQEFDTRFPPMTRILGIGNKAYPYDELAFKNVIYDKVNDIDLVILYKKGTNSALNTPIISNGKDIGSTGVFIPKIDNYNLTFEYIDGYFVDKETNSKWTILGKAISGPLKDRQLNPIIHADVFWFAWAAFYPNTLVY